MIYYYLLFFLTRMIFHAADGDDWNTQVLRFDVHATGVEDPGRYNAGTKQKTCRRSSSIGERRG